jgi:predicted Zn-dependent protease
MSRRPIQGFPRPNGHGRRQRGRAAVSRQANLVVNPTEVTTPEALKQALIDEVRRQGKPYGLRVSRVTGGETQTGTFDPQAFQVQPILVYRVAPDGSESLIRGVKLEGTPLSLLSNVTAAANDFSVFNGICGAESGQVPVSAISPSLLVSKIEIARAPKENERPPLLPPPARGAR